MNRKTTTHGADMTLKLGPFPLGANNLAPDYALPKDERGRQIAARAIVNADVLDSGHVRRRSGFSLVQAFTGAHSIWSDGARTLLVRDSVLYRVTAFSPAYAEVLVKVLSTNAAMSYEAVNGEVYCSNGTDFGRISAANAWSSAGLPTPATLTASAVPDGSLPAGKYQFAITYAMGSGEEGGAKQGDITLAADSDIALTLPAGAGGATHINVYLSKLNGSEVYLHSQVAVGTASVTLSALAAGRMLQTAFLEPLPAGAQVVFGNGRLMTVSGNRVNVSEPFNLGLYNPVAGFVELPANVSVVAPNQSGTYIVADKTYWFAGSNILAAERVDDVLPYGGTPGTFFRLPGEKRLVGWYGHEGVVIADTQGQAKPVQEGKYAADKATGGAVLLRDADGLRSAVFALTGCTKHPLARNASTGTTTYSLNLETGATSTYGNFAFNSMCRAEDGNSYALTSAGIHKLGGTLDVAAQISSSVDCGKQDFGSSAKKHLPACYVGAASSDRMMLAVEADGASYDYTARSSSTALEQHRIDPGKGLRANWFGLTLKNANGCDFEIADFQIDAAASNRRTGA